MSLRGASITLRRSGASATALLASLLAPGCSSAPAGEPDAVRDTAERGPLRLEVVASPRAAWLGDPIRLTIRVRTPQDVLVRFPPRESYGDLPIRDAVERDPRPAPDGGLEWQSELTIVSLASGTLEIPPIVVAYAKKPPEGESPSFDSELAGNTLRIEVHSALTTQDSPGRPRDISGTQTPPWRLTARDAALAAAVAAGAAGLIALAALWIQRRRARAAAPIAPEVWALRELARLAESDWIETGRARDYYYRLTEVVRGYVERKFGLAAPEMTTEEFLRSLDAPPPTSAPLPYDRDRLRRFLESCDLVKYAALTPRREDADAALGTARAFVDFTAAAAAASTSPPVAAAPSAVASRPPIASPPVLAARPTAPTERADDPDVRGLASAIARSSAADGPSSAGARTLRENPGVDDAGATPPGPPPADRSEGGP